MVVNIAKISQKMDSKSLLSTEKDIIQWEKKTYYNYNQLFTKKLQNSFDEGYNNVLRL